MHVDAYLARAAAHWASGQRQGEPVFPNDPESERPFLRFAWRAVCAHGWLQAAALHGFRTGDPRLEAARAMREHAEGSVLRLAHLISEPDPFEDDPLGGTLVVPGGADDPAGWLHVGLSALALELLAGPAGAAAAPALTSGKRDLAWMAEGFRLERAFALAEAGRTASRRPDGAERLRAAVASFAPAGETSWGAPFLSEARTALSGRVADAKALLKDAVAAVREVPELPRDAWSYVEPIVLRHGERLGIGRVKRFAIKTYVNRLAGK
jgi:hypothetical protein